MDKAVAQLNIEH